MKDFITLLVQVTGGCILLAALVLLLSSCGETEGSATVGIDDTPTEEEQEAIEALEEPEDNPE